MSRKPENPTGFPTLQFRVSLKGYGDNMSKVIDLAGQRFGRLLVVQREGTQCGSATWLCRCDCGKETVVNGHNLRRGLIVSCGCKRATVPPFKTHGKSKTRLHRIWRGMKQRCFNPNLTAYKNYGGRGITVCDEWLGEDGFQHFYDWAMANGYDEDLEIDRRDNDGDYEPSNCQWASRERQANNRRTNATLTLNNETHTIAEWTKITGISKAAIEGRLKRGWSVERTLTEK